MRWGLYVARICGKTYVVRHMRRNFWFKGPKEKTAWKT